MGSKKAGLVIAVAVAALLTAVLLPVALNTLNGDFTESYTQDEGQSYEVKSGTLESVATNVDATNGDVTYELTHDGETTTVTVSEGATETVTLGGDDLDVTVDSIDNTTATTTYEGSNTFGWDGSSKTIFGLLGLFVTLLPVAVFGRKIMDSL